MKAINKIGIFTFLLFSVFIGYGQIDSTELFKQSKGKMSFPVLKFKELETYTKAKSVVYETEPSLTLGFIVDSTEKVYTFYEGKVLRVQQIEDMYILITKYGRYFITYSGLKKPLIKRGDYLKSNEFISTVQKDIDDKYRLSIWLSEFGKNIDPEPWFKK